MSVGDINSDEVAPEVRKLWEDIMRNCDAQAVAKEVSNQKGEVVAESGTAKCHVCELELDPKELHDYLQIHVRAAALDAINSASSISQTLTGELADGQKKLMALAFASVSGSTGGGSNSGYIGGQSPGYGSLGYGPNVGYGSIVSTPSQSATGASGGFGGPNANAGYGGSGSYGSANAGYGGGSNSGYLGGQSPGYGSLGYGPNVGYGSHVSTPSQSATRSSGYGYGNYASNDGYDTNPGGYRAAAGLFGPGGATSGDPGGGYNGQTGYSNAAWRSDS